MCGIQPKLNGTRAQFFIFISFCSIFKELRIGYVVILPTCTNESEELSMTHAVFTTFQRKLRNLINHWLINESEEFIDMTHTADVIF